jgi:hypothetical protein
MPALGQAMKGVLFAYSLTFVSMNIAVYRGRGRLFRYLESLWFSLLLFICVGIFVAIVGLILGLVLGIAGLKVSGVFLYILFVIILALGGGDRRPPIVNFRLDANCNLRGNESG